MTTKRKQLIYPFDKVLKWKGNIEYSSPNGKDHEYVKSRGHVIRENADCSYTSTTLPGFRLSSYGGWGSFFAEWYTEASLELFHDMVAEGIIKPYMATVYINAQSFEYLDGVWRTFDPMKGKWNECCDPFAKFADFMPDMEHEST